MLKIPPGSMCFVASSLANGWGGEERILASEDDFVEPCGQIGDLKCLAKVLLAAPT